jgi:hypothetical protein
MDDATKAIMEEAAEKKKAKQEEAAYSKSRTTTEYNPKPRRTKDGKDTGEMGKPWHQMFN